MVAEAVAIEQTGARGLKKELIRNKNSTSWILQKTQVVQDYKSKTVGQQEVMLLRMYECAAPDLGAWDAFYYPGGVTTLSGYPNQTPAFIPEQN